LTARRTRAHMTQALMEGVVFSLGDSLEIMRKLKAPMEQVRAVGGGACGSLWRVLRADIYDAPIRRTTAGKGLAYGTALLGGAAAGISREVGDACARIELHEEVALPRPESVAAYSGCYGVYRSKCATNKHAMHRLSRVAAGG
jgi:xylulokinase